jgi:hypothetical protein
MKKKDMRILILYCIPWIFLTLYGDEAYGIAWQYGAVLAILAVGAGVLREHGKLLLFGNLLSCCASLLMVRLFGYDEMNYYFKPFTAYGWVMVLTGGSGIMQMLIWQKNQSRNY